MRWGTRTRLGAGLGRESVLLMCLALLSTACCVASKSAPHMPVGSKSAPIHAASTSEELVRSIMESMPLGELTSNDPNLMTSARLGHLFQAGRAALKQLNDQAFPDNPIEMGPLASLVERGLGAMGHSLGSVVLGSAAQAALASGVPSSAKSHQTVQVETAGWYVNRCSGDVLMRPETCRGTVLADAGVDDLQRLLHLGVAAQFEVANAPYLTQRLLGPHMPGDTVSEEVRRIVAFRAKLADPNYTGSKIGGPLTPWTGGGACPVLQKDVAPPPAPEPPRGALGAAQKEKPPTRFFPDSPDSSSAAPARVIRPKEKEKGGGAAGKASAPPSVPQRPIRPATDLQTWPCITRSLHLDVAPVSHVASHQREGWGVVGAVSEAGPGPSGGTSGTAVAYRLSLV